MEISIETVKSFIDESEFREEFGMRFKFTSNTLNLNGKPFIQYIVDKDKYSDHIQIRNQDRSVFYNVISMDKRSITLLSQGTTTTVLNKLLIP